MFVTDSRELMYNGNIRVDRDAPMHRGGAVGESDEVLSALGELSTVLKQNAERESALFQRIDELSVARENGQEWTVILASEDGPSTVQLISTILRCHSDASGHLRRSLAIALQEEGRSMSEIARLFGVTHQRVYNLLRGVV